MELRPYQAQCLRAVDAGWSEYRRQLIVIPTGGGKTVIFSKAAQHEQPGRVLILAHREELIEQAADKLYSATGLVAEIEKAERRASLHAPAVVASIQTMIARGKRWSADHFSLVVCDEAHHAISHSWLKVLEPFQPHAKILGVTATPDRGDKRNLGSFFESIPFEISLVDLIRQGYLAPITIRTLPVQIDVSKVGSVAGDFNCDDVDHAIEPYLGAIAQALRTHAAGRRILAFLPLRATSHKFVEHCRAAGLRALHVDGESPDRKEILERFECCEADVLSNAMLLTEGYDDPGIDCVLVLRMTRSRSLYSQMIGRGTRTWPLKDNLLVLDPLWMHERHSLCRPAHLIAGSQDEADGITDLAAKKEAAGDADEPLDLIDLQSDFAANREEKLRDELAKHSTRKATTITAEEFAMKHGNLALAEYEPTMPWESQDLRADQVRRLQRAKIDIESVRGRGHAAKILDLLRDVAMQTGLSQAQQTLLRRMGHPAPQAASAHEFRQWIARRRR